MAVKNAMTNDFLHSAYGGESLAHMRYLTWADVAEKEGFNNIAKLFRAISFAERVHAENHFKEISGPTTDYTVTAGGVFGYNNTVENRRVQLTASFMKLSKCTRFICRLQSSRVKKALCAHSVLLWKPKKSMPKCLKKPRTVPAKEKTWILRQFISALYAAIPYITKLLINVLFAEQRRNFTRSFNVTE